MNWINCDFAFDGDEKVETVDSQRTLKVKVKYEENERKKHLRLEKLLDPNKDAHRKAYINMASRFGELLLANNYEEIVRSLFTEDCEVFLFNVGEIMPVKYTLNPKNLASLYQGYKMIKREIKENNVDSLTATAFQVCYCEILNEQDNTIIPQFSLEVFSFRDNRICKYRGSFGSSNTFDEMNNPFTPSPKEKMRAKIKQLNYAWADQPDLEKIASLLEPSTEYKIWRWEDHKGFTFYKNDIVENFRSSLEGDYIIKCVVPYHIYSEGQYLMSDYVFYLEGKDKFPGEKFIWLSTCMYMFDKYLNIVKINQQGELRRQDEIEIPFHVFPRNQIKQIIIDEYAAKDASKKDNFLLDTSGISFSFEHSKFAPKKLLDIDHIDHIKGFNEYNKLAKVFENKSKNYEWDKVVDFYVDHGDDSYDVFFTIECLKGSNSMENNQNIEHPITELDFYTVKKFYIDNGKAAKIVIFMTDIPEAIPSPFDDQTFTTPNIQSREELI